MSPLLLDTHAYAWMATEPDRLSPAAHDVLADSTRTLLVSAATPWEMAIKHRAGKWPEVEILLSRHEEVVTQLGALDRPVTAHDAILAGGLAWDHNDPFDRMLAAQALSSGAVLVSRDPVFRHLPGLRTVW
jgi:PIN domain nuclease of toxin-antitoxin system